jgi:hypothetical protein
MRHASLRNQARSTGATSVKGLQNQMAAQPDAVSERDSWGAGPTLLRPGPDRPVRGQVTID